MGTSTSVPENIMVKLLKDYMLNPKLSRECVEFLGKTIIETHTESEISMLISICINNITDKINPNIIQVRDYVRVHSNSISTWKRKELGDKDLLIDNGIYNSSDQTYLGYIRCATYKDEYSPYYPTKTIALFNINDDLVIGTIVADFTNDLLIKVTTKEKMDNKWSKKVIEYKR